MFLRTFNISLDNNDGNIPSLYEKYIEYENCKMLFDARKCSYNIIFYLRTKKNAYTYSIRLLHASIVINWIILLHRFNF